MYLEISTRQSGKTHRAIQKAVKALKSGKNVLYVCLNQGTARLIMDTVIAAVLSDKPRGSFSVTTYESFRDFDIGRKIHLYIFDEFDFAQTPRINHNLIRKNGYYVTTPRFHRNTEYRKRYRMKRKWKAVAFDLLYELVMLKKYKVKGDAAWKIDNIPTS